MTKNYVNRIGETTVDEKKRTLFKRLRIGLGILLLLVSIVVFDMTVDRSGWAEKDGLYSYRDFHGRKITGWLNADGKTYYFGDDTIMVTGWQVINGKWYYFYYNGVMAVNTYVGSYYVNSNGVWVQ